MKVLKFGGTSVGTPERMKEVSKLISAAGEQRIVVLSAMSGTTNALVEIADYLSKNNREAAGSLTGQLRRKYAEHVAELYATAEMKAETLALLDDIFTTIGTAPADSEKLILAQGEIMSTNMVTNYLREQGVRVKLLPALDYMKIDENGEPVLSTIRHNLKAILENHSDYDLYITQGFICRGPNGEVENLQRGGSDYTACLIGAALRTEEIQIWTDIDGMHTGDPRFVEGTTPVRQLNFEEAAELAYFGAKILHPTCIQPARYAGVPVRLLNTMDPSAPGTLINNEMRRGTIKAVAAKDNITAVKIVSSRMLLATGFLRKIFEVFEQYKTPVDMVTTSEVGVSLSVDNTSRLHAIVEELRKVGTVEVDKDMCIVCVVGDLHSDNLGFEARVTEAVKDIPVRMISYGGSAHNISLLVRMADKKAALQALNENLFKQA